MNIVLNGVSSDSVSGLMIQRLPNVKKPLIRHKLEEIDGVNGDTVIKLGYSAYDREVLIGLRRSFNEDDVIKFFNTSGKAVFSNEPDKIYDYDILNEFELEKLMRFRQAIVTFHVQPFKHKLNETLITGSNSVTVNNSGNIFSKPKVKITGSGNLSLYIDSTQIFQIALGTEGNITLDGVVLTSVAFLPHIAYRRPSFSVSPVRALTRTVSEVMSPDRTFTKEYLPY